MSRQSRNTSTASGSSVTPLHSGPASTRLAALRGAIDSAKASITPRMSFMTSQRDACSTTGTERSGSMPVPRRSTRRATARSGAVAARVHDVGVGPVAGDEPDVLQERAHERRVDRFVLGRERVDRRRDDRESARAGSSAARSLRVRTRRRRARRDTGGGTPTPSRSARSARRCRRGTATRCGRRCPRGAAPTPRSADRAGARDRRAGRARARGPRCGGASARSARAPRRPSGPPSPGVP